MRGTVLTGSRRAAEHRLTCATGAAAIADPDLIAWISANVLPHEADVRAWLRRSSFRAIDPDDLIQEAYARIAASGRAEHIANGRAYFFAAVRNLALEHVRRSRVVRIETMAEIETLSIAVDEPSPEQAAESRIALSRVWRLIEELPERCRQVFILRKVHALSQREIAARLAISENTVEKHAAKGLKLILARLAARPSEAPAQRAVRVRERRAPTRERRGD
jgi:RNA polymerase sigma factor (sigma-70 family)